MGKNITIETAGIPGSGKSTFVNELHEELRNRGINSNILSVMINQLSNNPLRRKLITIYALIELILTSKLPYFLFATMSRGDFFNNSVSLKSALIRIALENMYKRHNKTVLLIDEGLIQAGATYFSSEKGNAKPSVLQKYFSLIKNPDILIFFNISLEESSDRMHSRGYTTKRIQKLNETDMTKYLSNQLFVIQTGKNQLKNFTRLFELDNHNLDDLRNNICLIADQII